MTVVMGSPLQGRTDLELRGSVLQVEAAVRGCPRDAQGQALTWGFGGCTDLLTFQGLLEASVESQRRAGTEQDDSTEHSLLNDREQLLLIVGGPGPAPFSPRPRPGQQASWGGGDPLAAGHRDTSCQVDRGSLSFADNPDVGGRVSREAVH